MSSSKRKKAPEGEYIAKELKAMLKRLRNEEALFRALENQVRKVMPS